YSQSGLVGSDVLSGQLDRATGETVGTYTITLGSLSAGSNYDMVLSGPVDFAITRATVTVTPAAGQSKTYGGDDPTLTFTAAGFAHGDTVSVLFGALSRGSGEDVGLYTITL